jgi:hypothetical protein
MPRLTTLISRGEVCSCLRSKQMFTESPDTGHYRAPGEPDDGLPNGPFWCAITQSLIGADGKLVSPVACRADRSCCEIC